eukprot:COSAG05_NODE_2653_length_2799_cov_5.095556_3_plen_285_part_00
MSRYTTSSISVSVTDQVTGNTCQVRGLDRYTSVYTLKYKAVITIRYGEDSSMFVLMLGHEILPDEDVRTSLEQVGVGDGAALVLCQRAHATKILKDRARHVAAVAEAEAAAAAATAAAAAAAEAIASNVPAEVKPTYDLPLTVVRFTDGEKIGLTNASGQLVNALKTYSMKKLHPDLPPEDFIVMNGDGTMLLDNATLKESRVQPHATVYLMLKSDMATNADKVREITANAAAATVEPSPGAHGAGAYGAESGGATSKALATRDGRLKKQVLTALPLSLQEFLC